LPRNQQCLVRHESGNFSESSAIVKTKPPGQTVKPPTKLTVLLATVMALALGTAAGIGTYTFTYAKGASYLGDDPASCANCHVMREHLDAWIKSTHHAVATCNDCHTPAGFIPKYFTKAEHGFFHSLAFTTDNFHEPILISDRSRRVTENACRKCHQDIVGRLNSILILSRRKTPRGFMRRVKHCGFSASRSIFHAKDSLRYGRRVGRRGEIRRSAPQF